MNIPRESSSVIRRIEIPLLILAGVMYAVSAVMNTEVYDEKAHINAGIVYWATGDAYFDPAHPPLRAVFAMPSVAMLAPMPGEFTDPLTAPSAIAGLYAGRLMMGLLCLACAWWISRFARRWWGEVAGTIALALLLFEPTLAAFASLVVTDPLLALPGILAACAAIEWLRTKQWRWALAAGALMGATLAAKYTAVFWLAGIGVGILIRAVAESIRTRSADRPLRPLFRAYIVHCAAMLLLALCILGAFYRFDGVGKRIGSIEFGSPTFARLQSALAALPSPVPARYLQGMDYLLIVTQARPTYFHGRHYAGGGVAAYFPVLAAMKPPLAFHALLVLAALVAWRKRRRLASSVYIVALPALFLFVYVAFFQKMQIGVRHILPVFPAASLGIAWAAAHEDRRWGRMLLAALVAVVVVQSVWMTPNQLGFFNALAGGPSGAWHWYNNSNQDWGQGENALARHEIRTGIDYERNPIRGQTTGWIAQSTNQLTTFSPEDYPTTAWLRDLEPAGFVPPYWHLYHIPEDSWRGQ